MIDGEVRIAPANEVAWSDLQAILTGTAARCQCTRQRLGDHDWYATPVEQRADLLRSLAGCDDPRATSTVGIVAFVNGEPAGWAAVDARSAFQRLRGSPVPWAGRAEDKDDSTVWAIACLVVRRGYRKQGLTTALVRGAVEHARAEGATAIEGYPMVTGGQEIAWDELSVGPVGPFLAAGFREVSAPTKRRRVMRLDLA
jgi:GNAT superfamily N-acetyltransferase